MINIFILNWESVTSVCQCINSILKSSDKEFRIILINNFSSDSDLDEIRRLYFLLKNTIDIHLVENVKNLGYAGGNNQGLHFLNKNNLSGDILIVNPDVLISENTIAEMRKALVSGVGIISVRTLDIEGKVLFDAIKLNGFFQKSIFTTHKNIITDYAQGSCLLINRELIDEIGLFDERFFLYWEEVDLSIRMKKKGVQLFSITTTQIIKNTNDFSRHPAAFYYSIRNARLIMKNHPDVFSNIAYVSYLFKMFLLTFSYLNRPTLFHKITCSYFLGIRDSILNKYFSKAL